MSINPYSHMDSFMEFLRHSRPQSVIDISMGNAKMGFVARDAALLYRGNNTGETVKTFKIEAIASDPSSIQEHHRVLYDKIHIGRPETVIKQLGVYDMVVVNGFMNEIDKAAGEALLLNCMQHCLRYVAVFLTLDDEYQYGWSRNEFLPISQMHYIRQENDNVIGAFLLSKEAFIDYQIEQLKKEPFQSAETTVADIRQRYHIDREHVGRINLKRFDKHVINPEHRNYFFDTNFREHYRLIAHLSTIFQGSIIFDIGTNLGYSSLALSYNPENFVVSYDLVECKELGYPEDLNNIEYYIGDVRQDPRLLSSPLIMLDTNHDGKFEHEFYEFLKTNRYKGLLFLDDIHLNEPMKAFWKYIKEPKEDITDLGHWSGSGLVLFP